MGREGEGGREGQSTLKGLVVGEGREGERKGREGGAIHSEGSCSWGGRGGREGQSTLKGLVVGEGREGERKGREGGAIHSEGSCSWGGERGRGGRVGLG